MTQKCRKKPVEHEYVQFVVWDRNSPPISFEAHGVTFPVYSDNKGQHILIPTTEGVLRCNNLDYILKGMNGELWCVKEDIFPKYYEKL